MQDRPQKPQNRTVARPPIAPAVGDDLETDYVPGERLTLMRKRLSAKWEGISLTKVKVTPDREPIQSMKQLKAARKKVEKLTEVVRAEAFDDWIARFVVRVERPGEWTKARPLYESYLRQARNYGQNQGDKTLAKEALATETQWGRMMGSLFPGTKRRRNGWYYPIRLKQRA